MRDAAQWPAEAAGTWAGVGDVVVLAVEFQRLLARKTCLMMAMYSFVRCIGLPNGSPCQPSITCGPDGPTPQMKRLPDSACSDSTVIAAQAGVRADICIMPVPALIFVVRARIQAIGVTASVL